VLAGCWYGWRVKQKKRTSDDLVGYLLCRDIDLSLLSQDVDCLKLT
jgi:hypothetical protein